MPRTAVLVLSLGFALVSCRTQEEAVAPQSKNTSQDEFRHYFHEAISEKMIGHYDRAIELFEKCLQIDQGSPAVHFALSDLYELQGDKNRAIAAAEKAYELDKLNKWYALRLADLYFSIGNYAKSADLFDAAIDENEENLELKFKYAEALIYSDQYQKAIDMMDEIEVETGKLPQLSLTKHDMYMALGEKEKAEAELTSLINDSPGNVENRVVVAEYFVTTNQLTKARQIAEEAIRIDPENGSAQVVLADIELRSDNVVAAFSHLKTAFTKDDVTIERKLELIGGLMPYAFETGSPDAKSIEFGLAELFVLIYDPSLKNAQLHSYYGTFLERQGKKAEALEQFRLVCALNPGDFKAWNSLLNAEYDMGDFSALYVDGQKAVDLFPSQPMFYLLTAIGAYETGKFNEAEEYLFLGKDLVVHDNELLAEFYYHLGKLYSLQKNYTEAYSYFEQSKTAFPQSAKPYGGKGKLLFEQKLTADAEAELKAGLAIDPANADILHTLGLLYISVKDYAAALKVLEKAAVRDYNNGRILESYGDALYLNGDEEKAVQTWIEAEKKGNNSAILKRKIADKTYYEN